MASCTDDADAQLILMGGFTIAVTMVTLALVLNSAIFAGNLATRENTAIGDTLRYEDETERGIGGGLEYVNRNNTDNVTHSALCDRLNRTVNDWRDSVRRHASVDGRSADVSGISCRYGIRILQTNSNRNLSAGGTDAGDTDWTLARDIDDTRKFTLNLSRGSLFEATVDTTLGTLTDDAFTVTVTDDSGDTWHVYIFEDTIKDQVVVLVDEPGLEFDTGGVSIDVNDINRVRDVMGASCTHDGDPVTVDMVEGTVGGSDCAELEFYGDLTSEHHVSYNDTETLGIDRARGTYELFVNESSVDQSPYYDASVDRSPFTLTALYNSQAQLDYRTGNLNYTTEMTIEPTGPAPDTAGRQPTATIEDVVDDTDPVSTEEYDFTVDWKAEDGDSDLANVSVVLTDDEGARVEMQNVSVGGASASGSVTFTSDTLLAVAEDDGNFTVQVTATDDGGNAHTSAETHLADDDGVVDTGDVYPSLDGPEGVAVRSPPRARAGVG